MNTNAIPTVRSSLEARLLSSLLRSLGNPSVSMELHDGEVVSTCEAKPLANIKFGSSGGLWKFLLDPPMQFGELYSAGELQVTGDLIGLLAEVFRVRKTNFAESTLVNAVARLMDLTQTNTLSRSRKNIHHHYDLGNEFYRLWLDSSMSYTCAYFESPSSTLEQAQLAKMRHVCRKLDLKSGESVVEAGCGWGSLALLMVKEYGVKVRAFNISKEQLAYARDAANRQGLSKQVEFVEDDYRNITGHYDAFVSVGMLEHVGFDNYSDLGRLVARTVQPKGRGLIHTIGRNSPQRISRWILKRIFPGAEIPSLQQMMNIFEPFDLSVLDVENLRLHYALTLEHWLAAFERSSELVLKQFDEYFRRMWRLYLAGSCAAFRAGEMQLFQVLFATAANNELSLTRARLYRI